MPKVPTQQRSRERFENLLDCAEQILHTGQQADKLSIYEVADAADLPAQAVYRLFPSAEAIIHGLVQRYHGKLTELIAEVDLSQCSAWQGALETSFIAVCDFYRQYPHAGYLLLGAGVTWEISVADREIITLLAEGSVQKMEQLGLIDASDNLVCHLEITLDIADAVWRQSYHKHDEITPFFQQESIRAATSYLELYLPRHRAGC